MGGRSCWSKGRFLFAGGISFVKEEKTCCREWMREERRLPRPAWSLPGRTRWLRKTATVLPGAAGTWLTSRNQLRRPGRGGLAPPASVLVEEGGPALVEEGGPVLLTTQVPTNWPVLGG